MTKYKATRIMTGYYQYRGWLIDDMSDCGGNEWFITPPGERQASGAYDTLREAKSAIDGTILHQEMHPEIWGD